VVASNAEGRLSGVFVNTSSAACEIAASDWDSALSGCSDLFRIDSDTGAAIVHERFDGVIRLEKYGVAALTNKADIVID
jgi:hypothetical protein